jgi:hypothetical protein
VQNLDEFTTHHICHRPRPGRPNAPILTAMDFALGIATFAAAVDCAVTSHRCPAHLVGSFTIKLNRDGRRGGNTGARDRERESCHLPANGVGWGSMAMVAVKGRPPTMENEASGLAAGRPEQRRQEAEDVLAVGRGKFFMGLGFYITS